MENFIEEINELMKPYYDYIEKNRSKNNSIIKEIENLRKEVEELKSKPEDKQQLDLKTKQLHDLMQEFDKNIKYRRVYVKEIIEIKSNILVKLQNIKSVKLEFQNNLKKQRLEKIKLMEQQEKDKINEYNKLESELHDLNQKVSSFKYEYDENHISTNDNELNDLFSKITVVLNKIRNIKSSKPISKDEIIVEITKLNELINFYEKQIEIITAKEKEIAFNNEEIKINSITLSESEQEEYNLRKGIKKVEEEEIFIEDEIPVIEEYNIPVENQNSVIDEVIISEQKVPKDNIPYDLGNSIDFDVSIRGNNITVKTDEELLNQIYLDIMANIETLDSFKINDDGYFTSSNDSTKNALNIKPNTKRIMPLKDEYISINNIEKAIEKYYDNDINFIVSTEDKVYKISPEKLKKIHKQYNNCELIEFRKHKRDIIPYYYELYSKTKNDKKFLYVGDIRIKIKNGFYISKKDFKNILRNVLKEVKLNNKVKYK